MIWDWVNLYHMYLFRLILQAKSFVLFYLWYLSCFKVKCWFHTFQAVFSYFYGSTNPFDHWGCHVNSFPTGALLFEMIPSFSPSARSILSFLNGVCFIRPQVAFVFPPSHPFNFKDSDFLIGYPFYWWEVSPFFSFNVLIRWFPMKMLNSFKFIILHCCFFSGGSNSSFRYSSYSFPHF